MEKMTDVVRNELFPTADMVVSMSREFGVPFTQKDFEGSKRKKRFSGSLGTLSKNQLNYGNEIILV